MVQSRAPFWLPIQVLGEGMCSSVGVAACRVCRNRGRVILIAAQGSPIAFDQDIIAV